MLDVCIISIVTVSLIYVLYHFIVVNGFVNENLVHDFIHSIKWFENVLQWFWETFHLSNPLKKDFQLACKRVAHAYSNKIITNDNFNTLYGYYKQATVGNFNIVADPDELAEHAIPREKWKACTGLTSEDAMKNYIFLTTKLLGPYKGESFQSSAGSAISKLKTVSNVISRCDNADFFNAASIGKMDLMVKLLQEKPELINKTTPEALTALHLSIDRGHLDIAKYLIKAGTNIHLHKLMTGANVNSQDENGDTPLHVASVNGSKELIQLLIKNGANIELRWVRVIHLINARNKDGELPEL
ncbi:bifunctional Acyl-CoA-binding protein [Babesia duncani]|uniref:Bifunctional Acyl-CoA-binding protein n=1 Tax=Babesia duncani TaxID=323732 RepID=A0AAD9PJL8_9APIC|nr:bifunctional Acyl-CoA-binding protein [Babesia duncani]